MERRDMDVTPELIGIRDAARMLGVSTRTLSRWASEGRCPAGVKLGDDARSAIRWQRRRLLAWIDAGCPRVDGGAA